MQRLTLVSVFRSRVHVPKKEFAQCGTMRWMSSGGERQRQQPQGPIVDTELVNAHDCVLRSRDDRQTLLALRLVKRGLRALGKGAPGPAGKLFMQSVDDTHSHPEGMHPAAWVACNALGVSLFLGAQHDEADDVFGQAQQHCEQLTEQGLVNDA